MKKILFFYLILCSSSVFSANIGKVLSTTGEVNSRNAGVNTKLSRGSFISAGETIVTGAGGKATIKYNNGTIVSIEPNSDYTIEKYAPDSQITITANLHNGTINHDSHSKTQKKSVVNTPVVALAILGTNTLITANTERSFVKVTEGEVCAEGTCIGPDQQFTSGTFDINKKFSAGEYSAPNTNSGSVAEISATVTADMSTTTINSIAPENQVITGIADIVVTGTLP